MEMSLTNVSSGVGGAAEAHNSYAEIPQSEAQKLNAAELTWLQRRVVSPLRPLKGCLLALLAAVFFSISNVFVRKGDRLASADHLTIFFALTFVHTFVMVACVRGESVLGPSGQRVLLSLRSLVCLLSLNCLYLSLLLIPPSDCVAIVSASILVTAVMSRLVLSEKLGVAHLLALLLTIVGVVLIAKPYAFFPHAFPVTNATFVVLASSVKANNATANINSSSSSNFAHSGEISEDLKLTIGVGMACLTGISTYSSTYFT